MDLSNLQADLDVVHQKISDEKQKGAEQNKFLVAQLEEQEAVILAQMDEEKVKQEQVAKIDKLQDYILSLQLFESIQPEPLDGERIHEYQARKQEFNQIQVELIREILQSQNDEHNQAMSAKDEKIRVLTKQGVETENQLAEANRENDENAGRIIALETQVQSLENTVEISKSENARLTHENGRLRDQVAEANAKLEQTTKPTTEYTAPSQPLQERLASLKSRSVDDMLARFNARQAPENKVEPPTIEPVQPFRGEADTTEPEQYPVLPAEATTLNQFQGETPDGAGLELAVPTPGEQTEVSREEYTAAIKRLEELEKQVFGKVAA